MMLQEPVQFVDVGSQNVEVVPEIAEVRISALALALVLRVPSQLAQFVHKLRGQPLCLDGVLIEFSPRECVSWRGKVVESVG